VHGFHYAFVGAACFVAGGLVVMLAMLRKRDLERIESVAAAEPVIANV
jgi:hypothetical protein